MLCISSFAGKIIIFWKRFCISKVVNVKSSSLIVLFGAYLVCYKEHVVHTWFVQILVSTVTYIIWKKIVSSSKRKFTKEKRAQMSALLFLWPSMLRTVKMTRCLQLSSYLTYTVTKWSRNKSRHHLADGQIWFIPLSSLVEIFFGLRFFLEVHLKY